MLLKTRILVFSIISGLFVHSYSAMGQVKSTKRGIAYGYHSESDMATLSDGASWWYNWSIKPDSKVASTFQNYGMDFVPMIWNGSFNEAELRAFYASHPNARFILGFNEPNFTTQANLKPSQAAALWPKLEKIAKDYNLKIVAPAVNYADKPVTENGVTYTDPIAYLDAFFAACPNCQVDYIAVHNYMCYAGALSGDINRYKKYNKPIWLTEFACWDQQNITLDMQKSYMMGAIDYLENDTCIFRYSWFNGNRSGSYPYLDIFKQQSGQLTDLGKLYVTFNPIHDTALYFNVPARIEAENYTTMSGINLEATKDVSGNANVGWIDANDWMSYNINVPAAGEYNIFFRISANASTSLELREKNTLLQTLQIPSSGGWQNWKTLKTSVTLAEGKQTLQLLTKRGQFNINWFEISTADYPTALQDWNHTNIRVFPNPVTDKLVIETQPLPEKTIVAVCDLTGQVLYTASAEENSIRQEIDFSRFKSGSYIVTIRNAETSSNHLIVK